MPGYFEPWRPDEDDVIRAHAGFLTPKQIAEKMPLRTVPRTGSAVMQRAVNHLRLSMRLGVRKPGDPPVMLPAIPQARRPRVAGVSSKGGTPPAELLSTEGARLLIGLAAGRGVSPRSLVKSVMEVLVREPTLLNNLLDEQG